MLRYTKQEQVYNMQIAYNLIICVKRAGDLMLHMLIFFNYKILCWD